MQSSPSIHFMQTETLPPAENTPSPLPTGRQATFPHQEDS